MSFARQQVGVGPCVAAQWPKPVSQDARVKEKLLLGLAPEKPWMCIDVYGMYSWRAASKSQWKTRAMSSVWFPFFWVWSRCGTMVVADLQLQIIPHWNSGIYCITILWYVTCIKNPTKIIAMTIVTYLLPAFNTQIFPLCEGKGNSYKSKNSR